MPSAASAAVRPEVLALTLVLAAPAIAATQAFTLHDAERGREVPVAVYAPAEPCSATRPCRLALISPGYGGGPRSHEAYTFLAEVLNRERYVAVGVQHELASDAPIATTGADLRTLRRPNWQRGAATLRFVQQALAARLPHVDTRQPLLAGHSNGGDISAQVVAEDPAFASALVTLDHRRNPLPRSRTPRVLTLRAGEFPADPGVLPGADEQAAAGTCVVLLPDARHADLHDGGPPAVKRRAAEALRRFLQGGDCPR